jgi:hypothetical protein
LPQPGRTLGAHARRVTHVTRAVDDGAGVAGAEEWRI